MRKRSQLNNGLDTSRYEIRVSTSNMFAHLEDCLESKRPKIPGPRNQILNCPKHKRAGKKPEQEVDYVHGEWALVTRRSKRRESPSKPGKVDADSTSCSRGDEFTTAWRDVGREEEKEEEDDQSSELCPEFNIDLDDDFPPLSRAGLPDGMVEKKPRRRAKKSLHPDAQSDSLARGDSVNLKGSCLAEGCDGDKEVQLVFPAGPQAGPSDGESQEADQDSSRAGADDLALFQFFTHEKLGSTDEEPSASEEQLRDDLNKLLRGKYSSQGILSWPPEKKKPRKSLQPGAQSSSPGAAASAHLEGGCSTQLCCGDEIVQSPAAEAQAAEEAEDEDEALGSSVEEEYITVEELHEELSRLLQKKRSSQEIIKWLQATIDDDDASSEEFMEVLMTCMCQSEVIVCDIPHIDGHSMLRWTALLKVFLQGQEKELKALRVLGDLMIRMQHPEGLLQMILDVLIDEEIIQESTFMKWKDSEEQQGNLELLRSVSRFFSWLQGYLS